MPLLLRVQQEEIESPLESGVDEEEASVDYTDSEHSSNEQDELLQDATRTPLNEDSHQHGLMLAAYREVGSDFSVDNGQLVKGLATLKCFESVPRRWPLARLLKSVEYLDRVLAGCGRCLSLGKTQMTPLVRCDKRQRVSLSHWLAILQISLLGPCEPPGHRKELWQMRKTYTCWVQISGSNPFTRSCCMLPLDIMSVAMEKESGRVVGLWKLWPSQGVPKLEFRL